MEGVMFCAFVACSTCSGRLSIGQQYYKRWM